MKEQEAILIKELNDISNANIIAVDNVYSSSGTYYLDITSNKESILSSEPVKMFCPKTSEFENTKKVDKLAYNLKMQKIN